MAFRPMRYSRVTPRHATAGDVRAPETGSPGGAEAGSKRKPRSSMQLTLNTVETSVIAAQMAGQTGPLPQTLRNRKSGLRRAAELLGMRGTDPANLLLGSNLESTITVIRDRALSKKATSDLISHLRWWDSQTSIRFPVAAAAAANPSKRDTHIDRKFKNFLRHHIKERGLTWEAVAEQTGIPLPTIYGARTDCACFSRGVGKGPSRLPGGPHAVRPQANES
jgi:hypothetical protein